VSNQKIVSRRANILTAALFLVLGTQVLFQTLGRSFFPFVDYDMFARNAAGSEYTWYFLALQKTDEKSGTAIKINRDLAPLHIRGFVRLMNERSSEGQTEVLTDLADYLRPRMNFPPGTKLVWNKRVIDIPSYREAEASMLDRSQGAVPGNYKVRIEKVSESL
jgi:hypothetical protein